MTLERIATLAFLALAFTTAQACKRTSQPRIAFFRTEPSLTCNEIGSRGLQDIALAAEPFLTDAEILEYQWASHTLVVSSLDESELGCSTIRGCGFVLVVDGSPAYAGVLMTPFSSAACPLPSIIFPVPPGRHSERAPGNVLTISPSYPGLPREGADPRSNQRLRAALSALGKLSSIP